MAFSLGDLLSDPFGTLGSATSNLFQNTQLDISDLLGLGGAFAYQSGALDPILEALGLGGSDAPLSPPVGYQGGIPEYVAVRERVPQANIPAPRPGAMGQQYFSDVIYAQKPSTPVPTLEEARAQALAQVQGLAGLAPAAGQMQTQPRPQAGSQDQARPRPQTGNNAGTGGGMGTRPMTDEMFYGDPSERPELRAAGGLLGLAGGGYYLGGPTDGMADKVPARIDGRQEARLSDGEFVVPADVVSHLGNGNSNAGAQQLYAMMDRVRKARTGRESQGRQINPSKYMPGMRA